MEKSDLNPYKAIYHLFSFFLRVFFFLMKSICFAVKIILFDKEQPAQTPLVMVSISDICSILCLENPQTILNAEIILSLRILNEGL